jgi:hypothetical protein
MSYGIWMKRIIKMARELMRKPNIDNIDNTISAPLPHNKCELTFNIRINSKSITLNEDEAFIVLEKLSKFLLKK